MGNLDSVNISELSILEGARKWFCVGTRHGVLGASGGGGSVSSVFFIYFLWLFSLSLKNAFKTAGRNPETAPFLKSAGFSEKKKMPLLTAFWRCQKSEVK